MLTRQLAAQALLLLMFDVVAAQGQGAATVVSDGMVSVSLLGRDNRAVSVALTTVRLRRSDRWFPAGQDIEGRESIRVIQELDLAFGDDHLVVPRSIFLDLFDPRELRIGRDGRGFIVTIEGEDGAESYRAEVHFDANRVSRRVVFSQLSPKAPLEDARYRTRVVP